MTEGVRVVAVGMVFLAGIDERVDGEGLARQLKSDWPSVDWGQLKVEAAEEGGPVVLDYGSSMIAVMSAPGQIGDDLPQIAQRSRLWPNAAPVPADYAAHGIVTVFTEGAEGHEDAIADARMLTRVLASLIALTDTVQAVYFGSADHVVLPALLRDLALEHDADQPYLWVALNVGSRPDGTMTGYTLGMDMLGLPDIEIPETPETAEQTFGRLNDLVAHLFDRGPVIGDGDTLGATEEAELTARHLPSALDEDKTVLTLVFDSAPK